MQLCVRSKNVGAIEVAQKIPYDEITVGDIPHVAFEVMACVAFFQIVPRLLFFAKQWGSKLAA